MAMNVTAAAKGDVADFWSEDIYRRAYSLVHAPQKPDVARSHASSREMGRPRRDGHLLNLSTTVPSRHCHTLSSETPATRSQALAV